MPLDRFVDLSIPRDANARPASVVFGYDPVADVFYPLAVEDMGDGTFKLKVSAEFAGSISIGNVSLKDATGSQLAKVSLSGRVYANADDNPMEKLNIKSEYTYWETTPGLGKVKTIKEYPSDAISGDPAKITSYTYNVLDKIATATVTDTTV